MFACLLFLLICKGLFTGCARRGDGRPPGRDLTLGVCAAPLSCWGRGCLFYAFCLPLLHSKLRAVVIRTVLPWPAPAEIWEPRTHGMHTRQSSPRHPANSGTQPGNKVCKSTTGVHAHCRHNTRVHGAPNLAVPPPASLALPHAEPTRGVPRAEPQPPSTSSATQPSPHTACPSLPPAAPQDTGQAHGHCPATHSYFPKPLPQQGH